MRKALIAMSGGVDSSVAAMLMKKQGFHCIGCTMKLYHNEDTLQAIAAQSRLQRTSSPEPTCICRSNMAKTRRHPAKESVLPHFIPSSPPKTPRFGSRLGSNQISQNTGELFGAKNKEKALKSHDFRAFYGGQYRTRTCDPMHVKSYPFVFFCILIIICTYFR